jgi:hypothetical protein
VRAAFALIAGLALADLACSPAADPSVTTVGPADAIARGFVERGEGAAYSPSRRVYAYPLSWQDPGGGEGRRVMLMSEDGRELLSIPVFGPSDPENKTLGPALLSVRTAMAQGGFAALEKIPWPDGAPELATGPFRLRLDATEVVAVRPSGSTIHLAPLTPHAPGEIRPVAVHLSADAPLMLLEIEYRPAPGTPGPTVSSAFGFLHPAP